MQKVSKLIKGHLVAILIPVVMIFVILIISPETRSWNAVFSLICQGFAPAILGWGVLFGMKVGNWDFSIGARVVLASIMGGNLAINLGLGIPGFIIFTMIISMALAVIVGVAYLVLNIPTLIVSIGIMLIFESISRIIYGGKGVHLSSNMMVLASWPMNFIVFVIAFVIASYIYYMRKAGYSIRAAGNNAVVAQTNGINVTKTKAFALIISGIFAGIYAILNTSISGVVAPISSTMGSTATVFDAMMCVLIGMAIARSGNIMFGVYAGAIITQILKMAMMVLGLPTTYNKVVIAIFVVAFMVSSTRSDLIDSFKKKFGKRTAQQP